MRRTDPTAHPHPPPRWAVRVREDSLRSLLHRTRCSCGTLGTLTYWWGRSHRTIRSSSQMCSLLRFLAVLDAEPRGADWETPAALWLFSRRAAGLKRIWLLPDISFKANARECRVAPPSTPSLLCCSPPSIIWLGRVGVRRLSTAN